MRLLPALLFALTLAGCAQRQIDMSQFTPAEQRIILQCRYEANAATVNMPERSVLGLEKMGTENKLFRQCVEAKEAGL